MDIHWYPGHMAKAKRMLQEHIKLVDVVVELIDARIPAASSNPLFNEMFSSRERILLLTKADLADPDATRRWVEHYRQKKLRALPVDASARQSKGKIIAAIRSAAEGRVSRMRDKGVRKTVRALVAGIPNVGKSTLINTLSGASPARVGNLPGVTRGKQWIRVSEDLELLDTPGLLWPRLDNETHALHLAYTGSIRDEVLPLEQLAQRLLEELVLIAPGALKNRFKPGELNRPAEELLGALCAGRGYLLPGGLPDISRGARALLDEYRAGKLGGITLERPEKEGDADGQTDGEDGGAD